MTWITQRLFTISISVTCRTTYVATSTMWWMKVKIKSLMRLLDVSWKVRYSDGLHRAIEAKEGVEVERTSLRQWRHQNYFRMYRKNCQGWQIFAKKTEREEFREIYNMNVCNSNKWSIQHIRWPRLTSPSLRSKFRGCSRYQTTSWNRSTNPCRYDLPEWIAFKHVTCRRIPHSDKCRKTTLKKRNYHVSWSTWRCNNRLTSMAGRGTDIKLGKGVKELGGLCVIGTERHESRRIDNEYVDVKWTSRGPRCNTILP